MQRRRFLGGLLASFAGVVLHPSRLLAWIGDDVTAAIVQSNAGVVQGTVLNVVLPSAPTNGNILVAVGFCRGLDQVLSGSGWTELVQENADSAGSLRYWYKIAASSSATHTTTVTATRGQALAVYEVSGLGPTPTVTFTSAQMLTKGTTVALLADAVTNSDVFALGAVGVRGGDAPFFGDVSPFTRSHSVVSGTGTGQPVALDLQYWAGRDLPGQTVDSWTIAFRALWGMIVFAKPDVETPTVYTFSGEVVLTQSSPPPAPLIKLDDATYVVPAGTVADFNPDANTTVHLVDCNLLVEGTLLSHPSSASVLHKIVFEGVNPSSFFGNADAEDHSFYPSDRGLWVYHVAGKLDLVGTAKTEWSRISTAADLAAGASQLTLEAAPTGWQVGDTLIITPTGPTSDADHFDRFDEVEISAINGAVIDFTATPVSPTATATTQYAHPVVQVAPAVGAPSAATVALAGTGGSVTAGSHSYKVTGVDAWGNETTASVASNSVTNDGANTQNTVTLPALSNANRTRLAKRRIYRNAAGGGTWFLLAEVAAGTLTYTDVTADGSLGTIVPPGSDATLRKMAPEVLNLTRNVRIEGTEGGEAHISIHNNTPNPDGSPIAHDLEYVALRYLGPRKIQVDPRSGQLADLGLLGRYPLHFHHCADLIQGTVTKGLVARDCGNHAFVAHESNGVFWDRCVTFNTIEEPYFWDIGTESNGVTYHQCVAARYRFGSEVYNTAAFVLTAGNGNAARGCVAVGGNGQRSSAGYHWPSRGPSAVWVFEDCLAHNSRADGIFVWQVDNVKHPILRFIGYNLGTGVDHGSYSNFYHYQDGIIAFCTTAGFHQKANSRPISEGLALRVDRYYIDQTGMAGPPVYVNEHVAIHDQPVFYTHCSFTKGSAPGCVYAKDKSTSTVPGWAKFIDCTFTGQDLYHNNTTGLNNTDLTRCTKLEMATGATKYRLLNKDAIIANGAADAPSNSKKYLIGTAGYPVETGM